MTTANEQALTAPPVEPPVPSADPAVALSDVTPPQVEKDVKNIRNSSEPTAETIADSPDVETSSEVEPRSRARERIEDLVAERNAAKEYAEYWRQQALGIMTQATAPPKPQEPPKPLDPVETKVQEALARERAEEANRQAIGHFEAKIEVFKEDHPDFDIVMANPRLPQLAQTAAAMIVESDYSAEMTYALGKDPALATRISRMTPSQQGLAIGRLETTVSKKPEPSGPTKSVTTPPPPAPKPAPAVTQAPPPPTPIQGGGAPDISMPDDVKDWMRQRVDEVRSRRRR